MKDEASRDKLIEELEKSGIVEVACRRSSVGRTTFYRWCREDPDFSQRAEEAVERGLKLVSDAAESVVVAKIKQQDLGAAKFWLAHRHPGYRRVVVTESARSKRLGLAEMLLSAFRHRGRPQPEGSPPPP